MTELAPAQIFLDGKVELRPGDCRDVIRAMPDNSVDSVVCDPPYALVSIVKRFGSESSKPAADGDVYARASAGFMGKQWDTGETAFATEFWAEVLRVLKPGGHIVAFSGTRTYHRMAVAIEDAGFEIRDQLAWCYGSGFPKSHDVSKGIDKARKDNDDWKAVGAWLRSMREAAGFKQKDVAVLWPSATGGLTGCVANWELGLSCPKWDQWLQLKQFIGFGSEMDAEVARLNGRKGEHGEAWKSADVIDIREQGRLAVAPGQGEDRSAVEIKVKAANSEAAREWQGWGTALKPAWEPICLARKPLIGTVAENVLEHGTGAINVDGCRVHADDAQGGEYTVKRLKPGATLDKTGGNWRPEEGGIEYHGTMKPGRWPANIVHDGSDEVVACFPDSKSTRAEVTSKPGAVNGAGSGLPSHTGIYGFDDSGSAARFFYTAKADKLDRIGSKHPTVKPVDLMQWLVRLVTPKGGLVLDPFAGSGSTGEAAWREGMRCILIEREEEYQADIAERLRLASAGPMERKARAIKQADNDNLPLFGGGEATGGAAG